MDVTEYAHIARALSTMDSHAEETLKRKFDVAYMLAKEGIAFNKMMPVASSWNVTTPAAAVSVWKYAKLRNMDKFCNCVHFQSIIPLLSMFHLYI